MNNLKLMAFKCHEDRYHVICFTVSIGSSTWMKFNICYMNGQTNLILDNTKMWLCSSSDFLSVEFLPIRIS